MSVKPIGSGDDPSKGPPLGRAGVMKQADFDAMTKSSNSFTASLTTTNLDSEIYKKHSVNYTDNESGQENLKARDSPDIVSLDQQSVPDGQAKFLKGLDDEETALRRGETIQSEDLSQIENQKRQDKKEIKAAIKEQKKDIKDVLADKLKKKMKRKQSTKKGATKLMDDLDQESLQAEGLSDSMTESDDDELQDEVPELFDDPQKNREAVIKAYTWTEKTIDPEVDSENAAR